MCSSLSRLSSSLIHRLARTRCQGQAELITSRSFSVSTRQVLLPTSFFISPHWVSVFVAYEFDDINGRHENFQNGFNVSKNGARNSRSINFVRGVIEEDGWNNLGSSQFPRYNIEQNADIVHVKLMKNNTFVTVTDSEGNKKLGASAGSLPDMKGGPKLAKYAAEATAEHVGRMSRNFGLKSVVMKVKGFTYFKKKRQAIISWKEGFTSSRAGHSPIVYIEDTTRKPHNGCRLPKQCRI
ncbi:hypothetical protein C1H46_018209 [Malus baccata]|uniref:Ribosomal protein S11 n=1 Tax=Malus baccata TaxID=106549 RepID=A0A540MBR4_MALBA|nr:hypothetical protein C1H46_018209 [Malus baccata]